MVQCGQKADRGGRRDARRGVTLAPMLIGVPGQFSEFAPIVSAWLGGAMARKRDRLQKEGPRHPNGAVWPEGGQGRPERRKKGGHLGSDADRCAGSVLGVRADR